MAPAELFNARLRRVDRSGEGERVNKKRVQELIRELLLELGEDPEREGPVANAAYGSAESYEFLTSGYQADPKLLY